MYYGSGLISNYDKYPEHKKMVSAKYPKKKSKPEETTTRSNHQNTEVVSIFFITPILLSLGV